jgi:hypothetical protein
MEEEENNKKSTTRQRSSNEKEICTAAEQIRIDLKAGLFGTCPEQRATSEYNSRSQKQGWIDGLAVGLAVADRRSCWLSQSILQARGQEEACQRS